MGGPRPSSQSHILWALLPRVPRAQRWAADEARGHRQCFSDVSDHDPQKKCFPQQPSTHTHPWSYVSESVCHKSNTPRYFLVPIYFRCWSQSLNVISWPPVLKKYFLSSQPFGPLSSPPMRTWINKEHTSRGAAKLCHTRFDRSFPSVTVFDFGGEGGGGKVKLGGWKGAAAAKKELPPYLESKFFTEVGEQILVPVSCFAVQPHDMVWTPSDPAPDQLQDPMQTLPLARVGKGTACWEDVTPSIPHIHSCSCQWGARMIRFVILQMAFEKHGHAQVPHPVFCRETYPTRNLIKSGITESGI